MSTETGQLQDHALGLAGRLTTGITLALIAVSVTALAVLSVV